MAEIDSLEIKIQSNAEKASQSIDKLVKKLNSVAKSLGSINTSAMSASINELTGKLSAINGKGFNNLNKSAKEAETTIKKVSDTAKRGIKSKISFDTKDYQTVIENLNKKFANAGKGFKTGDTLVQMQKQADSLSKELEKLLKKEDKIVSVGKMSPENKTFHDLQYDINAIMNNIDTLYSKMGQLPQKTKELSNINIYRWNENQETETRQKPKTVKLTSPTGYNKEAVAGAEAIYQKMYGNAEKAQQKTDSLGNKVDELKAKLKELSGQGLNFGDKEFDETYKKLNRASEELKKHKSDLEQTGNSGKTFFERMRSALANVSSQTNRTSGSMGKLASSVKKALHSVKQSSDGFGGFTKKIGLLYAKLYVLRRGFNALFGTAKSSMDYIEDLNYFNAAFGQVAEKADLKSFKEMGYDSAEAYYDSFSERAEELTQKMSGFKIEESGMAVSTGGKSLGIDPSLLMQNQAMFAQMSSSMGIASETAGKLSSVFTRLGGDIASLKNEDFQKVWQNMASGMTGMSRAVDKYGMNIREANLQQTLNNIGIDKSISKLTQQEKVLLRTIVMLDSSRAAWGDLAKTMNQPANQLRLLQSNWSNLSRTIGNIFLPIVAKVLPYLNAVTIMLQRFAEQIVKLLGFDKKFDWGGLGATGGADFDIDFGDAEDDTAGMANNMDKTEKKAKKAVDNIQGFDILNKLQDPDGDKDKDKDDTKGLSPAETGKLTGALDKLLSDYDKAWNKAFKGMENKANELANRMQKALVNAWSKGDFSKFGSAAAKWINKGLSKIPWDKIKSNAKKIASSIATFLNGFIGDLDWSLVGDTFADGLNTIIEGAYEFWTKFDFLKFGKSLSTAVNSFINKFDAKKFGKLLGAKLRGMIQFSFGFVSDFNFKKLGEKFGNTINGFFEDMGKVRKNTGLTGWQELGKSISASITGILDTINTALSTVRWSEIGIAIGQFIGSINWGEIFVKTGTVIVNALWSAVKVAMSAIAEDPAGIAKAAISIFGAVFAYKKLSSLISPLKGNIGLILSTAIRESKIGKAAHELGREITNSIKNGIEKEKPRLSKMAKGIGVYIGLQIGSRIGEKLGEALKETGKKGGKGWEGIRYILGDFATEFSGVVKDIVNLDFESLSGRAEKYGKEIKGITAGGDIKEGNINKNIESSKKYKKELEELEIAFEKAGVGLDGIQYGVAKAKKAFENGTISTKEFKKILSEWKPSKNIDNFLKEIGTNGARNTKRYADAQENLQKTMKKLNISSKSQGDLFLYLNNALDKGEISWKDYKKLTDGNYKSTKELNEAIKKLSPKSVKVKVETEGKKKVEDLHNSIKNTKGKSVTITAKGDTSDAQQKINGLSGKNIQIGVGLKKDSLSVMFDYMQKQADKVKIAFGAKLDSKQLQEVMKKIKSLNVAAQSGVYGPVKQAYVKGNTLMIPKGDSEDAKSLIEYAKKHNLKVKRYAMGGFPEDGWFRANHGEIMGKFDNGKSVVANNQQITDGIAQAVAPAVYSAFKAAMNEYGNAGGEIVINLDGKEIARSTIDQINAMTRQRGTNPILRYT